MIKHKTLAPGVEIFLGDCREALERMDFGSFADLVLTDPPYGIDYQSNTGVKLANDKEPPLWCIPMMEALMKDDTAMYVFTREDVSETWRGAMRDVGLRVKPTVIWVKGRGGQGDCVADQALNYEMLLLAHKGRAKLRPWTDDEGWVGRIGGKDTTGQRIGRDDKVWIHPRPRGKGAYSHPTTKPYEVMARAILQHSDPGDVILDPFMGSGPVGVAAVKTGRRYIGIELEPDYFQLAEDNILRAVEETKHE